VSYVEVGYQISERHACRLLGLGRSAHRYRARKDRDAGLRMRLKELAARRMRFGYRRLTAMLLSEGMPANHKRVDRLYREEGLAMKIRQRRRIRWKGTVVKPAASDKIGHSRNRLAQKWPSASLLMLVHNDDHPHPWVDTAFPAGHS
jgi:hypothetical protein